MYQNPMNDFLLIKEKINEIIVKKSKSILFYELSRSFSKTEKFILQDDIENHLFLESLSQVVVDTLSLFCSIYGIENTYSFLNSRSHWGNFQKNEDFRDIYEKVVKPFYELRIDISKIMLKKEKGFRLKPFFQLAKFEKYIEEIN